MDTHRCSNARMPRYLAEDVCNYVSTMMSDNCKDLTLVFPESGSACTELAVAEQLIDKGLAVCNGVVLMDALYAIPGYADHVICKTNNRLAIKPQVCCSYKALADVIDALTGVGAIIGIHQRTSIMTDSDHIDHMRYLRRCEEGHIHGTVLTRYLNFMYCGDIATMISVDQHGGYNMLPDSKGMVYVLDTPWRDRVELTKGLVFFNNKNSFKDSAHIHTKSNRCIDDCR